MEGAGSTLPPPCQLVPNLVEWHWNKSYLIWETHLVPSHLFLSSNHPSIHSAPFVSASCPAKPSAVQSSVQSHELSMSEVKTTDEKYTLHLLRYSLQTVKQVHIDVMNCQPVFGMTTHVVTGVPLSLRLCDCVVCVRVE